VVADRDVLARDPRERDLDDREVAQQLVDERVDRGLVVGETTFGKALVQSMEPLQDGAALELTIARYTTPAGTNISGVGVKPQIRAVDNPRTPEDEALVAALRVLARPAS